MFNKVKIITLSYSFFCTLICTSAFSGKALAIENLFSPCASLLDPLAMELGPNDVVYRGFLDHHWETGMEDQTGWVINDEQLRRQIAPLYYVYNRFIRQGDRVILLNTDGSIHAQGFYGEVREKHEIEFMGRKDTAYPNRPVLYADREKTQVVLNSDKLMRLFYSQAPAIVIQSLSQREKNRLVKALSPPYKKYLQQKTNPDRFVQITPNQTYELAYFEQAEHGHVLLHGEIAQLNVIKLSEKGAEETIVPTPSITVRLATSDRIITPAYGDRLFLINDKEELIWSGEIEFSNGTFDFGDHVSLNESLTRAARGVLIRTKVPR